MSFVMAAPELLTKTAADVEGIGSSLSAANSTAVAPTTVLVAAAGDEVSAAIASLFSGHATQFQMLSAHAEAFHSQFVRTLSNAGDAYAAAEAANASQLAAVVAGAQRMAAFSPVAAATGRSLIGNGANGLPVPGRPAAPGAGYTATAATADRVRSARPAAGAAMPD